MPNNKNYRADHERKYDNEQHRDDRQQGSFARVLVNLSSNQQAQMHGSDPLGSDPDMIIWQSYFPLLVERYIALIKHQLSAIKKQTVETSNISFQFGYGYSEIERMFVNLLYKCQTNPKGQWYFQQIFKKCIEPLSVAKKDLAEFFNRYPEHEISKYWQNLLILLLKYAMIAKQGELIDLCLSEGATFFQKKFILGGVITALCQQGNNELLMLLLSVINPRMVPGACDMLLYQYAIKDNNVILLNLLIEKGYYCFQDLPNGDSLLLLAIRERKNACARKLLALDWSEHEINRADRYGGRALNYAMQLKDKCLYLDLLRKGAYPSPLNDADIIGFRIIKRQIKSSMVLRKGNNPILYSNGKNLDPCDVLDAMVYTATDEDRERLGKFAREMYANDLIKPLIEMSALAGLGYYMRALISDKPKRLKLFFTGNDHLGFVGQRNVLGLGIAHKNSIFFRYVDNNFNLTIAVVAHELTHFLCQDMYDNGANPYTYNDGVTKWQFDGFVDFIKQNHQNWESTSPLGKEIGEILYSGVAGDYKDIDYHGEIIARTAEVLCLYGERGVQWFKNNFPELFDFYTNDFLFDVKRHRDHFNHKGYIKNPEQMVIDERRVIEEEEVDSSVPGDDLALPEESQVNNQAMDIDHEVVMAPRM